MPEGVGDVGDVGDDDGVGGDNDDDDVFSCRNTMVCVVHIVGVSTKG